MSRIGGDAVDVCTKLNDPPVFDLDEKGEEGGEDEGEEGEGKEEVLLDRVEEEEEEAAFEVDTSISSLPYF